MPPVLLRPRGGDIPLHPRSLDIPRAISYLIGALELFFSVMINALRKLFVHPQEVSAGSPAGGFLQPEPDGLIFCVDAPRTMNDDPRYGVRGWCAANSLVREIRTVAGSPLSMIPRPDVVKAHPNRRCITGFYGEISAHELSDGVLHLIFSLEQHEAHRLWALPSPHSRTSSMKARRLELAAPILACPQCHRAPERAQQELVCPACASRFLVHGGYYDFLPETLRAEFHIDDTQNVSAHEYDQVALGVIGRHHDGLVLDCGAGYRNREFPNVLNYEIVPYPSTDVLGVNERLPFRDSCFDAVLSLSVLEHVRDPMASAREILRVLKPGGTLYCSVPFLQPMHGYPHHYFNMTTEGLKSLFEHTIKVEGCGVIESGLPIWTLTWFLRSWSEGLNADAREHFLNMRVHELIGHPQEHLQRSYVTALSQEKNLELASSTVLLGRKS